MAESFFCIVLIFLQYVTDTQGILDFTCLNYKPRLQILGDKTQFIAGFNSGYDTRASVTFGRLVDTGKGMGLPPWSYIKRHTSAVAKLLYMPTLGGASRIGAFYCEAQKDGVMERIPTITMASNSDVTPLQTFQTVNLGDSATLEVERTLNSSKLRWRHNGNDVIVGWNGRRHVTIDNVTVSDGGIYECYWDGERELGKHAIFQLIVRACGANKWGPPICSNDCPICLNGGICDERSGSCVCAPGFTGSNCEIALGSNRWGQDGTLQCSKNNGNNPHSTACRGSQFCLPHPYGCSCAARYYGSDCNKDCPDGFYGADCKLHCHCASGVLCRDDTGECNDANCMDGWSGGNCQQQCSNPGQIVNLTVTLQKSNVLLIDWEPEESVCIQKEYVVEYELTKLDQCKTTREVVQSSQVTETLIVIDELEYYTTYDVYVTTILNGTFYGGRSSGVTATTGEEAPSSPPIRVHANAVTSTSISFKWSQLPCGKRRGQILSYLYILMDHRGQKLISNSTANSLTVTLPDLTPFNKYAFQVAGVTGAGAGPLSEAVYVTTNQTAPDAPIMLTVVDVTKNTITMTWQEPTHAHYLVEKYYVSSKIIRKPYDLTFRPDLEAEKGVYIYGQESHTFTHLKPTTEYEIKVFAHSGTGKGEHAQIRQFTLPATAEDMSNPKTLPPIPDSQVTPTTVTISIPRSTAELVTGYQVGVEWIPTVNERRQRRQSGHYLDTKFYIAAEIPKSVVHKNPEFVIGDNGTYGLFYNGHLIMGQTYKMYTALVSRVDKETYGASWSEGTRVQTLLTMPSASNPGTLNQKGCSSDTWLIVLLVAVIFVCIIALLAFVLKMRQPDSVNPCSSGTVSWTKLTSTEAP